MSALHAVILAGGGGTRLWPLSRKKRPKQFIRELGGGRSLIAQTAERVVPLIDPSHVWVVAGGAYDAAIREHIPTLPPFQLVTEPAAKNTAPAIGLACARIVAEDPAAVVAVLPSDHSIRKPDVFRKILEQAAALADEKKMLVTFGIVPDRPATGYGWIEKGEALGRGAFRVARFVEKPDAGKAVRLLASGTHLWNSGMFVWRAADLLDELEKNLPELGRGLREIAAAAPATRQPIVERVFAAAPSISIDYAVMEKSARVAVFPADIGWDDVGTFRSLPDLVPEAMRAREFVAVDASRNVVFAPGKTVALVGVDDLIVIETDDALLVMPRSRAEDVKKVVDELAKRKRDDVL